MSLHDKLTQAHTEARKTKDQAALSIFQVLLSAVKNEQIKKGAEAELSDSEVESVLARQVKQLRDAFVDFESAGRDELVKKTQKEIELLESYLPEQISDQELEKILKKHIEESGTSDVSGLGKLMGSVMPEVKGKADGQRVRTIASKLLSN